MIKKQGLAHVGFVELLLLLRSGPVPVFLPSPFLAILPFVLSSFAFRVHDISYTCELVQAPLLTTDTDLDIFKVTKLLINYAV